ncbi:hypothetical protein SDC9_161944 [bioreactor metagenome]|uniref:Uncharacterized protein n=1 Tax=bioreactor metagenome TaxID=1076179 RepID=A0A645FJN5_9ZZZZ
MYEEDSKLFVSSDFFKIFVPFAGSALQSSKWFKIADINSSSWTLDSFKLDNLPIPIGETPVTFSGYLKLKVNKLANETLAMKWGNIDAYTFEIKGVISGKINLGGLPMPLADMDIFKVNLYFKEEKGLLQVSAKPFEINLMSGLAKFKVPGFEKLLIRTNVQ